MDSPFIHIAPLKQKPSNTDSYPENPRHTCELRYAIPIFTPAAHTVVVKRLMHRVDKIHLIIDSKTNGQTGIMCLFWKRTYKNRRP
ncbi:hypothetical protein AH448_13815 [Salmonella enterica subsp. diarizonae]|uniref:Uncharacterized protein n=6 Tax=Salmonella enterica TaxID=28901 RepID=A0A3V4QUY0_SALET|nr:hypothetical protein LFZ53_21495 [Salmonella enterica subsp. diarizonae serovar 50:k:z str. MZ0080]EAA0681152.1 hypothetical protein [Salmonella enterica subsp. diarizonae]EAA7551665.1 hypothetical protein [Salmonella enterica]EAA7928247.1 hypothetical protein [Salmonella enterica subsp. enterica serovar Redlands]EAS9237031.1 hypothetical protein [Salmonella enterica subsp. enterica]EBW1589744.1 hypothetical protein [Salmonella enterica subsp. diarizonae serovar 61:r:z]EBW8695882.1 hypothe